MLEVLQQCWGIFVSCKLLAAPKYPNHLLSAVTVYTLHLTSSYGIESSTHGNKNWWTCHQISVHHGTDCENCLHSHLQETLKYFFHWSGLVILPQISVEDSYLGMLHFFLPKTKWVRPLCITASVCWMHWVIMRSQHPVFPSFFVMWNHPIYPMRETATINGRNQPISADHLL